MTDSVGPHVTERRCLLVITGAFRLGGGIAAANRLAIHALHDAGHQLTILALNESQGSEQSYAPYREFAYQPFSGNKLAFTLQVWRALLRRRFRLIFCDHVNLAAILAPLARLRMIRYTVRLHGIEVWSPKPNSLGRLGLHAASCRLASTYTHQRLAGQFPNLSIIACDLSLGPTQVIPQSPTSPLAGCSFTAVDGSIHVLGSQVILHVGRMAASEQYKGQDTLIQAMPLIMAAHPEVQLVLVGHGDDAPRLRGLVQAQPRRVQSAIFMPGHTPDATLDQLYSQCYLFAMPSQGEGFGFVYIEAMRWGKPCLGSRVDSARCIIQEGVTGLLVDDPSSPEEVAKNVIALLNQPEKAAQMGAAGRIRVQNLFTFDQFKVRFLKALDL